MEDSIQKLLLSTTTVYAVLIVLGFSYLNSYYKHFNIKIGDYATFLEIVRKSLDGYVASLFVVGAIVVLVESPITWKFLGNLISCLVSLIKPDWIGPILVFILVVVLVLAIVELLITIKLLPKWEWLNNMREWLSRGRNSILLSIIPIAITIILASRVKESDLNNKAYFYFNFALITVAFSYFIASRLGTLEATRIKRIFVSFRYEKNCVKSDTNNYYIGQIQSHLFFHRSKEKRTIAYPMSKITDISFADSLEFVDCTKVSLPNE